VKEYERIYMPKQFTFFLCLMLAISFVCYSQSSNDTENLSEWVEIYQITLESYLHQDTALNANIDFIAIDMTTLEFTDDYDKKEIAAWLEKQYVPVIDTNFDGLRTRGLLDEMGTYIPNGVFLSIYKVTRTNNEIIINGVKYRSAEGANWFRTTWRLNNGIWEFAGTVMTAIS
jgi:hypothetical protein